jgi:hypothetical protein
MRGRKQQTGRKHHPKSGLKTNDIAVLVLTIATIWLVCVKYREYSLSSGQPHSQYELAGGDGDDSRDPTEYSFEPDDLPVEEPAGRTRKNKWKSATSRQSHAASNFPLPSLDGLPVYVSSDRLKDVFVTRQNYERLLSQYKRQRRQQSDRLSERRFLEAKRSFPADDTFLRSQYDFSSCAVVGNSGTLLNGTFGSAIDSHSVIVRINQAMTNRKFQRHVGLKTTFRIINTRWTNKYGDPRFIYGEKDAPGSKGVGLPLEENVTLVSSRSKPNAFDTMVQYQKVTRPDVKALYLSSRLVSQARRLLVGYRVRLDRDGLGPYYGGSTPSSGFLALFAMIQLCTKVTAYGFGLDAENGAEQGYHYFQLFSDGERKKMMNPTHSFDAERDLMRALGTSDSFITYCGYKPRNRKHNKHCGHQNLRRRKEEEKKLSTPHQQQQQEKKMGTRIMSM